MNNSPLLTKSKDFALEIIKVCNTVKQTKKETVLSNQLIRSATSIGANAIVTASVSEYVSLKSVAKDVEIISLEDLILGE